MKKWIAFSLIMALLLGFAACGSVEEELDKVADAVGEQLNRQISRGSVDGDVYTSDFSGLTFTKPGDWVYATNEEIAKTMNVGADALGDENAYLETVAKLSTVYDMMVADPATGSSVSVMYENLTLSGSVGMSEEDYIDAVRTQLEAVEGMDYSFDETTTMVVLSGQVYRCFTASVTYSGIQMQQNYYVRAMDEYMNVVIVTLVGDTPAEDVEAMFS